MPFASSHVIPKRRATAVGVASLSQAIANRSNKSVECECRSAHGTRIVFTPWASQRTRGTGACTRVAYWHVSRCGQLRST